MKKGKLSRIMVCSVVVCLGIGGVVYADRSNAPTNEGLNTDTVTSMGNYADYEQYGLVYDGEKDVLYYDGKLIRYFDDSYDVETGITVGTTHYTATGEIDVYGVRDPFGVLNDDGTSSPGGKLTGLRVATQQEFSQFDTSNAVTRANVPVADANGTVTGASVAPATNDGGGVAGSSASPVNGTANSNTTSSNYEQYVPFGMTYELNPNNSSITLYYEGQLVRYFQDIIRSTENGTELRKTHTDGGLVDVIAVRDSDGNLTGLKVSTQEEFDQRTANDEKRDTTKYDTTAQNQPQNWQNSVLFWSVIFKMS